MKPFTKIAEIFLAILTKEKTNLILWIPVLFGFGAAFYLGFSDNFSSAFFLFLGFFVSATLLSTLNHSSLRSLIFTACAIFLAGSFYANFFDKIVLDHTSIEGKIFVNAVGKVEDIRKFYNPINKYEGANLLIVNPILYKSDFVKKENVHKAKVKKPNKKKVKKKKEKKEKKPRKPRKKKERKVEETSTEPNPSLEFDANMRTGSGDPVLQEMAAENEKPKKRRGRKKKKIEEEVEQVIESTSLSESESMSGSGTPAPDPTFASKVMQEESSIEANPSLEFDAKIKTADSQNFLFSDARVAKQQAALSEDHVLREKEQAKTKKTKPKKPRKISDKKIQKTFVNIPNYQDLDRGFLDSSKNYQQVNWREVNGNQLFPNPPPKVSVNLLKDFQGVAVNDVIAARLMLAPASDKEFRDDFDFAADARSKKIGAYGFVLGDVKIMKKSDVSSLDEWFLKVREAARSKIINTLNNDSAAIALAFLIGDQNQISKNLMNNIRNSGLAHLLSISGFHLALASAIFLVITRFLLSRSEYLALNFDLKKIAAIIAIGATYFYLKLAASPVPAQRSFLMVLFMLLALFAHEKVDARRSVMSALFFLLLANPYNVFSVSFQLTFAAILMLGAFHDSKIIKKDHKRHFLIRFFYYFLEMVLISILIEIATLPFLMRYFQNAAVLGFIANILAVPLTSFVIMPLGFLALFLMPFGLEKFALLGMEQGIFLLEKIANFVANLDYSYFTSPQLSKLGMVLAVLGLFLICLSKSRLIFAGIIIFLLSFSTLYFTKKPDILFDGKQKFFALYDKENGLIFSEKLKPSKKRQLWLLRLQQNEFKSFENFSKKWQEEHGIFCNEEFCKIEKNKKFLVLLTRTKTSEICKNDFDVIVNLTAKYELPDCIKKDKIKIDNKDFYKKGGHFFYFEKEEMRIETTN